MIELPLQAFALTIGIGEESGPKTENNQTVLELDFGALNTDTLRRIGPDIVVSWLFCDAYDAYDIAAILTEAKFGGKYIAMSGPLPRKQVITREIRKCFPKIDFELSCPTSLSEKAQSYYRFVAETSGALVGPRPPQLAEF